MVHDAEIKQRAARVKLLLMDCDGVLTDGRIELLEDGDENKMFHTRDGHGIVLMHRAGLSTGIISGRSSSFVERRARELGMIHLRQGTWDKVKDYSEILAEAGVTESEVAYIGDDVTDIPLMQRSGLAIAVADAVFEVRANAHFITTLTGGFGAVREACEIILKAQGQWDDLMKRYVKSKEEGERRKAEG